MPRIDYDEIAHLYDEPSRDHTLDSNLLTFLEERDTTVEADVRVIDIGCGTGKQLAADHQHLPVACLVGIDRFQAMLRIGQKRCPSVGWIQADGAALPLASASVDYATSQFSYPHIGRTRELLLEVFRVLKAGGRFVMTNIDPWLMPGWLVYQYFPEAHELDRQDFVPTDRFLALMRDVGFDHIRVSRTDLSRDERLDQFLAYVSRRHRASQLMAISDAAYHRGLQRLEKTVAHAGVPQVVERSEFVFVTIIGDKPPVDSAA
jgi:ubiquinone/menaquinone biosynthesis C-methylase UbiE